MTCRYNSPSFRFQHSTLLHSSNLYRTQSILKMKINANHSYGLSHCYTVMHVTPAQYPTGTVEVHHIDASIRHTLSAALRIRLPSRHYLSADLSPIVSVSLGALMRRANSAITSCRTNEHVRVIYQHISNQQQRLEVLKELLNPQSVVHVRKHRLTNMGTPLQ